jgi:hypothetical protein
MNAVKKGDIVKSFDFPGNLNCYMVGTVTEVEGDFITCVTIKQVFDGKALPNEKFNKEFRTVAQGAGMFDDKFQRVMVVG